MIESTFYPFVPGHTHSWQGIEGLLTQCQSTNQPEELFDDMKGPINPVRDENYVFLEKFFAEVCATFYIP